MQRLNIRPLGYDSHVATREDDLLERWQTAADIMTAIRSTPSDWSVRIGVIGKWGEGKTSVLKFVETMAAQSGYVPFWFNPWAAGTVEEMWTEFANTVIDALEDQQIEAPGGRMMQVSLFTNAAYKRVRPAKQVADSNTAVKVTFGALAALRQMLAVGAPELEGLRSRLGGLRLVALIDDLDRADPKLLPQLFLALRDVLDLPGFTFVLGFDDGIVAAAISSYHPAWSDGNRFLDKILDFRFLLPEPTPVQIGRLIEVWHSRLCPFVPGSSFKDVADLLPNNPRQIKQLLRSLSVLGSGISRFDADEINWLELLVAHLMRIESPIFLREFSDPEVLDEEVGTKFQIREYEFYKTKKERDPNATLKTKLDAWGIKDLATTERLVRLVEALRTRGNGSFLEQAQLTVRQPLITAKEFRSLLGQLRPLPRAELIRDWVRVKASERDVKEIEIVERLCDWALSEWHKSLNRASEIISSEGNAAEVVRAMESLDVLKALALDTELAEFGMRNPDVFGRASDVAIGWAGWRRNASDRQARSDERKLLMDWFQLPIDAPEEYLEAIKPWKDDSGSDFESSEAMRALRRDLVEVIAPRVTQAIIGSLSVPSSISRLRERDRMRFAKWMLLAENSPLRSDPARADFLSALTQSAEDRVVHENAIALLTYLLRATREGGEVTTQSEAKSTLLSGNFAQSLWAAVISRGIQYRMLQATLEERDSLVQLGIDGDSLPIPDWLEERRATPNVAAQPLTL